MVELETGDRQKLVGLLLDVRDMQSENNRRKLLEYVGLVKLAKNIDLSGSPFMAVNEIVSYLAGFGRLSFDHEALGILLNGIKSQGLVGVTQQDFLDALLLKYQMMTPIATIPVPKQWKGAETSEQVLERIIGENTLRPIAFLTQGLVVARAVAYIGVNAGPKRWSGTGFLVSPGLFLTNHHVIPEQNLLPGVIFRFNYEENFKGEALIPVEYRARVSGFFKTNETLDYTLVELDGEPGKNQERGWLPLLPQDICKNDRVNIIQHPAGRPKEISLQNNFVEYVSGNVVQYVTATEQGSSGSPVLNDSWEVVALHHAGGDLTEPTTQRRYFRNEGILVSRILSDLPEEIQASVANDPAQH